MVGSGRFCQSRIDRGALFPDNSDSAEDMIAVSNLEDLPDLLRDCYSSSSDHFSKERYLLFVEFNGHRSTAPPLVPLRETINISHRQQTGDSPAIW